MDTWRSDKRRGDVSPLYFVEVFLSPPLSAPGLNQHNCLIGAAWGTGRVSVVSGHGSISLLDLAAPPGPGSPRLPGQGSEW